MTLSSLLQQPLDPTVLVALITALATLAGVALGSILTHVFASRREKARWEREQEEEKNRLTRSILLAYSDPKQGFTEREREYIVRVQRDLHHLQDINLQDFEDLQLAIEALERLKATKMLDGPKTTDVTPEE